VRNAVECHSPIVSRFLPGLLDPVKCKFRISAQMGKPQPLDLVLRFVAR